MKQVTSAGGAPIRILIVGGGCAGMSAALRLQQLLRPQLRGGGAEITVVEPQSYLTYQPLLAEVAAGSIDPRHVVVPLRRVLPHCRVLTARVTRIDHAARRAWIDTAPRGEHGTPTELAYDLLVAAPGSVSRTAPVPGLAEHGLGFATVGEAVRLRNHVLEQLDLASSTRDPALRQAALTFVFVGAGYAGVGAIAELEDMARYAARGYHNLAAEDLRWVLVEATDRILPEESPELAAHTLAELRDRSVDVRLGTTLDSAVDRVMTLSDGSRFAARTLVWTAGVRPAPLLRDTDLPLDAAGRVRCLPTLQIVGPDGAPLPDAWAVGDCAAVPVATAPAPKAASVATVSSGPHTDPPTDSPTGSPTDPAVDPAVDSLPDASPSAVVALCAPNAQHALAQADLLAANIAAALAGRPQHPYRPTRQDCSTSLGIGRGVAHTKRGHLTGRRAWWLHRARHLQRLPSPDRRVRVLTDWLLGSLFNREVVSLGSVERPRSEFEAGAEEP
ncbi:NAD(P)/FAD-dependent oxidoreductase [Kitasatospora sp. NPDC056138]|uniref:NAD(P)/FAD-dependent oxidoreductase n=1 Tax=Kitasatospora sp. NPDC056138 TaxID=3345724 RepID=UPI0035E13F3C